MIPIDEDETQPRKTEPSSTGDETPDPEERPIEEVADELANDPEISDQVRAIARTLGDGFAEGRYD